MLLGAADLLLSRRLLAQLPMLLVVLVELLSHLPLAAAGSAGTAACAAIAFANILLSNAAPLLLLQQSMVVRHPRWLLMMTSSTSMIVDTRWGIGSPPSLAVVGLLVGLRLDCLVVVGLVVVGLVVGLSLDWWASSRLGGKHSCIQSRSASVCSVIVFA